MLFLDTETYNEVDISAGAHIYARTAEVLILTVAESTGPVLCFDLTESDHGAVAALSRLLARNELVCAHNAQFDRLILREAMGLDVPLERWRCSMVKALAHGFPASLEKVGAALGLPVEMSKIAEGKKLIRRFCMPAPKNHKADRYTRETHPGEWGQFLEYATRDTEAMREIWRRLPDWNYRRKEIELYHLDQRINERGMRIDRELVEAGVAAAANEKQDLLDRCAQLTGGLVEKPTMREKLRQYLNTGFGLDLANTQANTLRHELKRTDLPKDARALMEISIAANKASTAKYAALAPAIDDQDARFRGGLQFDGAARTRRWCLPGNHEVLTRDAGWQRLDEWSGGDIAQWRAGTVTFEPATRVWFDYTGPMYRASRPGRIECTMSPEHRLCAPRGGAQTAGAAYGGHVLGVPRGGVRREKPISTIKTRILVMLQHDGYDGANVVEWSFVKRRKYTRCLKLLACAGVPYTTSERANGVLRVSVSRKNAPDWLVKRNWGPWLIAEAHDPRAFVDELQYWDVGNRRDKQVEVCAKRRVNAEWTVTMAHLAGYAGTLSERQNGYWYANITFSGNAVSIKPEDWSCVHHEGPVYCAVTRTGYFLVRCNGVIHVTGNSGRTFQPHNLPSRGLPPAGAVALYIDALKAGVHHLVFDDLMLFSSAALRGVVVAPPGRKLAVSDLSNIEGRKNAWVAGEQWKLDAFRAFDRGEGPDLYNITATSIVGGDPYDVPKVTRNVFGKVPDLALGYEGGVGALQTFAKAYGVRMADHWETIQANIAREHVERAAQNYRDWGRNFAEAMDIDAKEWVASETVKLAWRARHPAVCSLWAATKEAFIRAFDNPGRVYNCGKHLQFRRTEYAGEDYMLLRLPAGRFLVYYQPEVKTVESKRPGADGKIITRTDRTLSYMGQDTRQGSPTYGKWARMGTYGGKLVENICQSSSRDVLAEAMPRIESAGFEIVLTVHDEVVTECALDRSVDELSALLAEVPTWAPGLPLAAAGFEADRYRKDD